MEFQTSTRRVAKPDMTPLVDLGFLLITFFMYTTTFTKPNQMHFTQPFRDNGTAEVAVSNTLTLILGKGNRLYYYQKELPLLEKADISEVEFKTKAIGNLLKGYRQKAKKIDSFTVIIKPTNEATYQNFVDILDEMTIFNQQRYSVVELTAKEGELLGF